MSGADHASALQQRAADAARAARDRIAALRRRPPTMPTLPATPAPPKVTLPTLPMVTLPTLPTLPPDLQAHLEAARTRRAARRNRVVAVVVAVLLALWLWRACDEPAVPAVAAAVVDAPVCPTVPECGVGPVAPKPKAKPTSSKKPPRRDVTVAQGRDLFAVPQTRTPPWLTALRMQVSARSLALSRCFTGAERPGAMRLTASVTPSSGTLADVVLESLVGGPPLTADQVRCATTTLAQPPYQLPVEGERDVDLTTRVSLVLEF